MAKPINIASNWTLVLKIFFPILWGAFFGLITIAFWFSDEPFVGTMPIGSFRLLMSSFFFTGMAVLYFSFMQLKRVEVDEHFLYVTNYKDTARYPFHNVEKLEEANYFLFKIIRVYFKESGIFGQKVIFLTNQFRLQEVLKQRTALAQLFEKEVL